MLSLSVKTVAKLMGKSEQYVRIGLQRKLLPFGTAMIVGVHGRGKRYSYHIPAGAFADYMGISYEQLNKELEG